MMGEEDEDDGKEDEASAKPSSAPARERGPKGKSVRGQDGTFYGEPSDVHIHDVGKTPHLKLGGKGQRIELHGPNLERAYAALLDHAAANSKANGVEGVTAWFAHHHAEIVTKVEQARRAPPPPDKPAVAAPAAAPQKPSNPDDPYGFAEVPKGAAKPPDEDDFM